MGKTGTGAGTRETVGTASLLEQLRAEAARDVQQRLDAATAEAARLTREATAHAERQHAHALAEHERALLAARTAALAAAQQSHAQAVLTARADALNHIFEVATVQLASLASDARLPVLLGGLLRQALPFLPDGPATVQCAPGIAAQTRAVVESMGRAQLGLEETPGTPLGVIVRTGDGRMSVDATFVRQLARDRGTLAIWLCEQIDQASA